jgi:tol-pal system protein YbgF
VSRTRDRLLVRGAVALALGGGAACASSGDVRRVESEVAQLRAESARRDSARAAQLGDLVQLQRRISDSLAATATALRSLRGDVGNDLYSVQQQLVQLQELTGQSQQRLSELHTQLEARGAQLVAPPATGVDTGAAAPSSGNAGAPSADQMYDASLQQLRKGSTSTARSGLSELLKTYPTSERVPDALYFIGQSWATENPDSARFYYNEVVRTHPESPRAASALYNLGLLAERRKDNASARESYQRVIAKYPKSDEAALAKDRLKALGR